MDRDGQVKDVRRNARRAPANSRALDRLGVAAIGAATAVVLLIVFSRPTSTPPETVRLSLLPPSDTIGFRYFDAPALSPDGRRIAFASNFKNAPGPLWIRALSSLEAQKLDGTIGREMPFWSPDGRFLAFCGAWEAVEDGGIGEITYLNL